MTDPLDASREAAVDAAHGRVAQIELEAVKRFADEVRRLNTLGITMYDAIAMALSDLESRTPLPKAQNKPTKFCCSDS